MVHYKPIKVTINTSGLAEKIIDMVVRHYGVLESIITDQGLLLTSSLCPRWATSLASKKSYL